MVDPTSDHGEDVSEEEAPNCETCGDPIVEVPTHRVVSWIEDGQVQAVHFCDEQCRNDFDADR